MTKLTKTQKTRDARLRGRYKGLKVNKHNDSDLRTDYDSLKGTRAPSSVNTWREMWRGVL